MQACGEKPPGSVWATYSAMANTYGGTILLGVDEVKTEKDWRKKCDDGYLFSNPGTLKLLMEEIYHGGVSAARNPRIQNMLRMIGYGDNLGTGFPGMVEVWENTWGEKPVLNERCELLIVDLSFGGKESKNSHENPHEKIDALDVQIMTEINNNSKITHDELSALTGKHRDTIRVHLKQLKEKGLIVRVGPAKGGHWEVVDKNR